MNITNTTEITTEITDRFADDLRVTFQRLAKVADNPTVDSEARVTAGEAMTVLLRLARKVRVACPGSHELALSDLPLATCTKCGNYRDTYKDQLGFPRVVPHTRRLPSWT